MAGYTKLFSEIVMSTIWREPNHTRLLWVTMLALMDEHSEVMASVPGLADAARITIPECEDAIDCLMSPDPYSRNTYADGRRIEKIDGGWRIINGDYYRQKQSEDERREKNRRRQQRWRDRQKQNGDDEPDDVFDEFWSLYPRKVNKKKAQQAFDRLTKENQQKAIKDITHRYDDVNSQFIPHPTTYINGERWNDEMADQVQVEQYKGNVI